MGCLLPPKQAPLSWLRLAATSYRVVWERCWNFRDRCKDDPPITRDEGAADCRSGANVCAIGNPPFKARMANGGFVPDFVTPTMRQQPAPSCSLEVKLTGVGTEFVSLYSKSYHQNPGKMWERPW